MIKETREELEKAKIISERNVDELRAWDSRRRKEFTKALGLDEGHKYTGGYRDNRSDTKQEELSWEQIFVELGKLLATRNFVDFEGNVSALEVTVKNIEDVLNGKKS